MGRNDIAPSQAVILPSSFIGGPRHMSELYHDSMALVRHFGTPSFFITMTTNPDWPEIAENLEYSQTAQDRPDLVARVFRLRFLAMIDNVTRKGRLGHCLCWVWTIEFQKRALPHAHVLLIMDQASTPRTALDIDRHVSADLPDVNASPDLHKIVKKFMIHGPCTPDRSCYRNGNCRLGYPRENCSVTTVGENSYPTYARPPHGRTVEVGSRQCTNRDVVPYNPFLLLKYD